MKIPWPTQRCIVCLSTPQAGDERSQMTDAHVIPESVGGRLSASFLCKRCNDEMGRVESFLPRDITVRLQVDAIREQLPRDLVNSILSGQQYYADTEEWGRLTAVVGEHGELELKPSPASKGDEHTLRQLEAALRRENASAERVAEVRLAFEQAAPNEWVDVAPGYRVQKHIDLSAVKFKLSLTDPIVPLEVPVWIGYLYLALCLGDRVYDEVLEPARTAIRAAMAGDPAAAGALSTNRHSTETPSEPVHLLRARTEDGATRVTFQIFRKLAWPVYFPSVTLPGEQTLYHTNVTTGSERWATKLLTARRSEGDATPSG
jgi:hypothetical protein